MLSSLLHEGWDVVVDFVAFEPADVAPVIAAGGRHVQRYIFISTDSVYMAVDPQHFQRQDGLLLEASDAGGEIVQERACEDEYGADKMATEAVLRAAGVPPLSSSTADDGSSSSGINSSVSSLRVLALRLPDVIGPHENTGRLRSLLLRLLLGKRIGTGINGRTGLGESLPLSLVAAGDVASAICASLVHWPSSSAPSATSAASMTANGGEKSDAASSRSSSQPESAFRALHICADERITWTELVGYMAAALRAEGLEVASPRFEPTRDTGFVSVDVGALSNGAAKAMLHVDGGDGAGGGNGGNGVVWTPAPLVDRVREAVAWSVQSQREEWERERREHDEQRAAENLRETLKRRRLRREVQAGEQNEEWRLGTGDQ